MDKNEFTVARHGERLASGFHKEGVARLGMQGLIVIIDDSAAADEEQCLEGFVIRAQINGPLS